MVDKAFEKLKGWEVGVIVCQGWGIGDDFSEIANVGVEAEQVAVKGLLNDLL